MPFLSASVANCAVWTSPLLVVRSYALGLSRACLSLRAPSVEWDDDDESSVANRKLLSSPDRPRRRPLRHRRLLNSAGMSVSAPASNPRRGLLIVFEGCDRSGKTTLCKRLVEDLNRARPAGDPALPPAAEMMRFPDRNTALGGVIDEYLRGTRQLDDRAIHLMFSANRWEREREMRDQLAAGTHLVVDRYAFSGVAFSAAKDGLTIDWCRQPDRGLPAPDLVCFLDVSPAEARSRGGFGQERYEEEKFQAKVRANYDKLMADQDWKHINTDGKNLDQVYCEVNEVVNEAIERSKFVQKPLGKLWDGDEGDANSSSRHHQNGNGL